ncbi:MAG: hypothetical protein II016_01410 [Erysipelotrichaceae bacterium]|nr:hypothetical protein [Erysipelotrichaceae bacterium]
MKAEDIAKVLKAKKLSLSGEHALDKEYSMVFATDLMSDALAMIQKAPEETVLLTGLCNAQSLRTAQMLDLELIVIVRGKQPNDEIVEMGRDFGITVLTTPLTMYEACGVLYREGMRSIS